MVNIINFIKQFRWLMFIIFEIEAVLYWMLERTLIIFGVPSLKVWVESNKWIKSRHFKSRSLRIFIEREKERKREREKEREKEEEKEEEEEEEEKEEERKRERNKRERFSNTVDDVSLSLSRWGVCYPAIPQRWRRGCQTERCFQLGQFC